MSAIFCSLTFATTYIALPTPIGNVNLGDFMLLLGAWLLGWFALIACPLGQALCDIISGWALYAPATLVIKSIMVLIILLFKSFWKKHSKTEKMLRIISSIIAELIMIIGYFTYEAVILSYGLSASITFISNGIQGAVNILLAFIIYALIIKTNVRKLFYDV